MIILAKPVNGLAGDEDPSSGRRHIHDRMPSLLGRFVGTLDTLFEASLGVEGHADWLRAIDKVSSCERSSIQQGSRLSTPITSLSI